MVLILLPVTLMVWELVSGSVDESYISKTDEPGFMLNLSKLNYFLVNTNKLSCVKMQNSTWTMFKLTNVSLSAIPPCLPRILKILNLSNNKLSVIDYHEIVELPKLQILALSHNNIEALNWTRGILGSLETLDLSYNWLSSVPTCLRMPNLKWLSLAGNPLKYIPPLAFSCFPTLAFLNLSETHLGIADGEGIGESAFSVKANDGITNKEMANLTELDLSNTFLTNIRQEWTKDLPNLKKLYILKMPRLKNLNTETFMNMPLIEAVLCEDVRVLNWIESEILDHHLYSTLPGHQNCPTECLNHFVMTQTERQTLILIGSALHCSCELQQNLCYIPGTLVMLRANETSCHNEGNADEPSEVSSSISLPELYKECQTISTGNGTLNESKRETSTSPPIQRDENATQAPTVPESGSNAVTAVHSSDVITLHATGATGTAVQRHNSTIQDQGISASMAASASSDFTTIPTKYPALLFEVSSQLSSPTSPAEKEKTTQVNPLKKSTTTLAHIPRYTLPDYEEDKDEENMATPAKIVVCDYHPCKHLQKPCHELQRVSPCYCPGVSPDNVIPDPPRLSKVSEITDTSVQIHWCAPHSVVRHYQLVFHSEGSEDLTVVDNIYVTARQYTLYELLPATTYQVCVITINKAGSSQEISKFSSRIPCTKFKTRPSYVTILAAICATTGFLLLVIIILSACLFKKMKGTSGDYDTHLVSYKNPAFDYHLKMQTFN